MPSDGLPTPGRHQGHSSQSKLNLLQQAGFNLGWLSYNVQKKPFDKLEVRQALDMAINKPAILAAVYQGAGQPATNPMAPTQWSYNKKLKDAPFDPAKAKAMLAKAGVADGTEITLWAMPVQRAYNPNAKLMAEMIQADGPKLALKPRLSATNGANTSSVLKRASMIH
nr:ABC transporter substrate-binding protein [Deefgea sp. CFH1-16]